MRNHIAKLKPKPQFATFNAGLWGYMFEGNVKQLSDLREALYGANITGVWKTTTGQASAQPNPETVAHDSLMCHEMDGCLNLTRTNNLNGAMFWDNIYMYEPAYRKMNEQMLEMTLPQSIGTTEDEKRLFDVDTIQRTTPQRNLFRLCPN